MIYDSGNKKFAGRDGNTTHPSGRVVQRMVNQGESRGLKVGDLAIIYAYCIGTKICGSKGGLEAYASPL